MHNIIENTADSSLFQPATKLPILSISVPISCLFSKFPILEEIWNS